MVAGVLLFSSTVNLGEITVGLRQTGKPDMQGREQLCFLTSVSLSWKQYKTETWLLLNANRKSYVFSLFGDIDDPLLPTLPYFVNFRTFF